LSLFKEVGVACSAHGRGNKYINILVGIPEGRRPLGRPWCRWEGDIRMDVRKRVWGCGLDAACAG